jgi:hypothetical protein
MKSDEKDLPVHVGAVCLPDCGTGLYWFLLIILFMDIMFSVLLYGRKLPERMKPLFLTPCRFIYLESRWNRLIVISQETI